MLCPLTISAKQMAVPVSLSQSGGQFDRQALVDSGAVENLINQQLVTLHSIPLETPLLVCGVDGAPLLQVTPPHQPTADTGGSHTQGGDPVLILMANPRPALVTTS